MPKYKNILVAINCYQDFEEEVGIFVMEGGLKLVGEAILSRWNSKLYADLKTEENLDEYFPVVKSLANKIDVLILSKTKYSLPKIKDQV